MARGTRGDRREFFRCLGQWGIGAAGWWYLPAPGVPAADARSRVVVVLDARLAAATVDRRRAVYAEMLDAALSRLFEVRSGDLALSRLFAAGDVVGVKVNCLAGPHLSTDPQLCAALADALVRAGLRRENVIVWDRKDSELEKAGFPLNAKPQGLRCYGSDSQAAGYEERATTHGQVTGRLSRILTEHVTVHLSAPVLKDHEIAGFTCALKNWYGAINNPNKYHAGRCSPFVADLAALPAIRRRHKLIVCDAARFLYHGGPSDHPAHRYPYNGMLVATDPVALDAIGLRLIEEARAQAKLKSLAEEGRAPAYLAVAADADHALGVCDPDRIELLSVRTA